MDAASFQKRRLVVISNRLPFTVIEEKGELFYRASAGGLVTGMRSYLQRAQGSGSEEPDYVWIGWPGIAVEDPRLQEELRSEARDEFHAHPVFVGAEQMSRFYHGFCNATIWPLFHYFPTFSAFVEEEWEVYREVNQIFCDAVMEVVRPDDVIWVHDYHLMLLPQMLRERLPDAPIGFFLHIPFPAYEIFRLLPQKWRTGIVEGLLGADLLGFHTYEYSQYFSRAVLRTLGYESTLGRIQAGDRPVQADTFPMGIDYDQFHEAATRPEVEEEARHLAGRLAECKIVLSIDRLDYSKGIINRLEGYQLFLRAHPEWHDRVVLALVIVPSRAEVEEYAGTKTQIEELVGRINGEFGSIAWTPILYQYRAIPFQGLVALYVASDVALITPLRDGMNLIAKEYVAAQADGEGVLILSELTGAATELGEALLLTPTSRLEIADAILAALEMPVEEQRRRIRLMQQRIQRYDVVRWAQDFVEQLFAIKQQQQASPTRRLDKVARAGLADAFRSAGRRILLLDYDGTLVPFAPRPEQATPGSEVRDLLQRLGSDPRNEVMMVSGRDKDTLEQWLGALPLTIVAEHGAWIKPAGEPWRMFQPLTDEWKSQIRPLLERYAQRLPGALVEEKSFSLAWHYRQADRELGPARAKELLDHLMSLTGNLDVRVLQGNKVIEVRPGAVSKAVAARTWELDHGDDFILAVGDDWTDEDLFVALPPHAYTIRVGHGSTAARFRVRSHTDVLELLGALGGLGDEGVGGTEAARRQSAVEG